MVRRNSTSICINTTVELATILQHYLYLWRKKDWIAVCSATMIEVDFFGFNRIVSGISIILKIYRTGRIKLPGADTGKAAFQWQLAKRPAWLRLDFLNCDPRWIKALPSSKHATSFIDIDQPGKDSYRNSEKPEPIKVLVAPGDYWHWCKPANNEQSRTTLLTFSPGLDMRQLEFDR